MKQQCEMLLLPDQTYEQCQAILTPILAIRKILQDSRLNEVSAATNGGGKQDGTRIHGSPSKKAALETLRRPGDEDRDPTSGAKWRGATPENFVRTSEFFNNIPDYTGDPLGPFGMADETEEADGKIGNLSAADVLKECEEFLQTHRIRPDFFCRYRKAVE